MNPHDRRDLYNGFGNGLTRAFELAVMPVVFAIPGWFLDRWLGTGPFLAIATGAFGLAGIVAKTVLEYSARMDQLQAVLPGAARQEPARGEPSEEVAA